MSDEMKNLVEEGQKALAALNEATSEEAIAKRMRGTVDPILDEKIGKINADFDAKYSEWEKRTKEAEARADALEARVSQMNEAVEAKGEGDKLEAKHREAFKHFLKTGNSVAVEEVMEQRALSVSNDEQAGYLVAPDFIDAEVSRILSEASPVRQYASVVNIAAPAWVKNVNVGGSAARWRNNDLDAGAATAEPTFKKVSIPAQELEALYEASHSMLSDSRVNLESLFAEEMGIAAAELESPAFVDGDGVAKPRGFLSYTNTVSASYAGAWETVEYHKTGEAADFNATNPDDVFIDVIHSLKQGYKANARFFMNRQTLGACRKLRDDDERSLFQWDGTMPATLAGEAYTLFEDMPDIAANAFPIAYGDLSAAYQIVDREGLMVMRDPYSSKPNVQFYGLKRVGGGIKQFEAIKLIKMEA